MHNQDDHALQAVERLKQENALALEERKEQASERIEHQKHLLTLERETLARDARASEVRFLEAGQHMRALNAFMWQVPGIAIAVTGGLWYGASTVQDSVAKAAVLGFAAVIDALLVLVIWRVRFLFQQDLKTQLEYRKIEPNSGFVGYVVVTVWSVLLVLASSLSAAGALNPERVAQRSSGVQKEEQQPGSRALTPLSGQANAASAAGSAGTAAPPRSK